MSVDLPLIARGKVREIYDAGDDRLLLVASDRISAYDHVLPTPIPDKGKVLTQLSVWWFDQLREHLSLVGDRRRQHVVVGGNPVRGHQQQPAGTGVVDLPHLAPGDQGEIHAHFRAASRSNSGPWFATYVSGRQISSSRASSSVTPSAAARVRSVSRNGVPVCHVSIAADCTSA